MIKQFLFFSLLSISFLIMPLNTKKFLYKEKTYNSSNEEISNLKIIYVYMVICMNMIEMQLFIY